MGRKYYLDLDPHEDLYRIVGILIVLLTCGVLAGMGVITADQFMSIAALVAGYFAGRVRGKAE